MMAYRSTENETTCFTPNYLMLCREVSTLIDIMYEIPPNVKTAPKNQWVWELKESMEEAHAEVRPNTQTAMLRQKRYHDIKLSWQKFANDDEAYVYFLLQKSF